MRLVKWLACKVWGHEFGYWWGTETFEYYKECSTCGRKWMSNKDHGWVECR